MSRGFSTDFREKVVEFMGKGGTEVETARIFGVSRATLHLWKKLKKETGGLEEKIPVRKPFKIDPEKLKGYVANHADATLKEIAEVFNVCQNAIWEWFQKLNIVRKKRQKFIEKDAIKSAQNTSIK